jgi:hypothetical protein
LFEFDISRSCCRSLENSLSFEVLFPSTGGTGTDSFFASEDRTSTPTHALQVLAQVSEHKALTITPSMSTRNSERVKKLVMTAECEELASSWIAALQRASGSTATPTS